MLARLLSAFLGGRQPSVQRGKRDVTACRLVFVANDRLATLEIYFLRPLAELAARGSVTVTVLTERELQARYGKRIEDDEARDHWLDMLDRVRPAAIVFCRYSGPHADALMQWAKRQGTPTIFHLDDDLLDVPLELGAGKFRFHNHPVRKQRVRMLLDEASVIYASTPVLASRLRSHHPAAPVHVGPHALAGAVLAPHPADGDETVVGYMSGSDHGRDLALVVPAMADLLDRHQNLRFDLWGATARPVELERFDQRIRVNAGVVGYGAFMEAFGRSGWHIGLCPLAPTPFNEAKSCIKWIECAAAGAAVVASSGLVYDDCCAGNCGVLVPNETAAWSAAIDALVQSPEERRTLVRNAQRRLVADFSVVEQQQQLARLMHSIGVPLHAERGDDPAS